MIPKKLEKLNFKKMNEVEMQNVYGGLRNNFNESGPIINEETRGQFCNDVYKEVYDDCNELYEWCEEEICDDIDYN